MVTLEAMAHTSAGGVDGGGGKSIVCRDSAGSIKSAEVLDLLRRSSYVWIEYPRDQ